MLLSEGLRSGHTLSCCKKHSSPAALCPRPAGGSRAASSALAPELQPFSWPHCSAGSGLSSGSALAATAGFIGEEHCGGGV